MRRVRPLHPTSRISEPSPQASSKPICRAGILGMTEAIPRFLARNTQPAEHSLFERLVLDTILVAETA